MKNKLMKIILILLFITVNIGCDQITKAIARTTLQNKGTIQVVSDIFVLYYTENSGAFLSMGNQWYPPIRTFALIVLPIIFLIVMSVYIYFSDKYSMLQIFGFCCIIGGGLSNIYDRIIHHGFVTDFMNFGIGKVLRTGVLNVADLSVCIGVAILLLTNTGSKPKKALN